MSDTTLDRIANICLAVGAVAITVLSVFLIGCFVWFMVAEGRRVFRND